MSSLTRTIKVFGAKATMTFHVPTNEEFNGYSNELSEIIRNEDDPGLVRLRVRYFDKWLEKATGIEAADLLDQQKSGIMFQLFEKVDVDEKN